MWPKFRNINKNCSQTFDFHSNVQLLELKPYLFSFLEYVCLKLLSTFLTLRCLTSDSFGADILD